MGKKFFSSIIFSAVIIFFSACNKAPVSGITTTGADFKTLEQNVINDFTNKTALAQYDSLLGAANSLNDAIVNLKTNTTGANLQVAQAAWKHIRTVWEQCEGFLIGPIETYDYDPNTDTWPTDHTQMDSLIASNHPLEVSDIPGLQQNLRGYHPIEYLIFRDGEYNVRTAASFTPRQLQYLSSLASDILNNNVQNLYFNWTSAPVNYAQSVLTAGTASNTVYPTKLSFFLNIVGDNGMAGICNEVGEQDADGKMFGPYIGRDSTITESPYSDNSLNDFRNNIISVQNVYMGVNGGLGLKDLVAAKNKSLDNQIQAQISAAVSSFNNITERYEQAIFDQRVQIQQTMNQLIALQNLLENDLTNFIKQYILD